MQPVAPLSSVHASSAVREDASRHLALALVLASGFAGLGYQIVWTQQSALWLGHETPAMLAVVAAFFGGIAAGSFILGPRIDRSVHPARWYAACELTIGVWSIVLALLHPVVAPALLALIGPQPSPAWHGLASFTATFLLLAPATIAMGGTLPAIERMLPRLRDQGVHIATLYAGNTLGAVLGVLATAFWLIPSLGLKLTASLCALLNFLCAAAVLKLSTHDRPAACSPGRDVGSLGTLAATGLLGIGYEIIGVRVLSQVAENTVYTFALALAVYLLGTSCGAAAYAHWRRDGDDVRRQGRLLQLVSLACLLGMLSLIAAEQIRSALLGIFGSSMASALLAEALLAMLAFLLPTMMMGALFSHLSSRARARQIDFGRVLGVNTLGAAIAPIVFGVWLLPTLGSLWGLLVIATGYLALVSPGAWRQKLQWVTGLAIAGCALWSPTLALIDVPPQGRLISHVEGTAATVSVVEDAAGTRRLHINNRQQEGSSATVLADARQALLPILLHPAPRRALFLGLGTGITALSATTDPDLQVDVVELIPEVIVASEHFTRPLAAPFYQSRLRVMQADARRFVRTTAQRYDLVISDNFHPARSGSGALYTVEHFRAVRARLNDDGIFCQWLPLHQLDLATLRSIVRAYLSVYPHAAAMLATNSLDTPVIGLIANNDATGFSLEQARARLSAQPLASRAASFGVVDELALLGSFIADSPALHDFAGAAPLNTDDHPIVIYQAPRVTYEPDSQPRDRLIELLRLLDIEGDEWLSAGDKTQRARLTAYWSARNRFIEVGRDVRPSADVQLMLQQVREPLLDIVRISPDFRPAYDPLLQMARALATVDASDARSLLLELERLQPARLEATQLLRSLDATVTR